MRKREQKALEKQQADKYFVKIKDHSLKPKHSIVKESTKSQEFNFAKKKHRNLESLLAKELQVK